MPEDKSSLGFNPTEGSFETDTFDTIIIDEAHRIGAKSYQEIMDYFKPKFWLGMSASPERTDDFDVYAAFDHNIAYISLLVIFVYGAITFTLL